MIFMRFAAATRVRVKPFLADAIPIDTVIAVTTNAAAKSRKLACTHARPLPSVLEPDLDLACIDAKLLRKLRAYRVGGERVGCKDRFQK